MKHIVLSAYPKVDGTKWLSLPGAAAYSVGL